MNFQDIFFYLCPNIPLLVISFKNCNLFLKKKNNDPWVLHYNGPMTGWNWCQFKKLAKHKLLSPEITAHGGLGL